jgi:uncharacterized protein with von Willebrand factor type A (vWA) domain
MSVKDESYIRAGLAKSAFRESIYEGLPWQYYMDYITSVQRMLRHMVRTLPRVYQAHDAFLMFYKPYDTVWRSLKQQNKAAPIWHKIVSETIRRESFYEVNRFTRGSVDLSILAAYQFLKNILNKVWSRHVEQAQQQLYDQLKNVNDPRVISKAINDVLNGMGGAAVSAIKEEVKGALQEALTAVREYTDAKAEAEAAIEALVGSGGSGFDKEALSVLHFLDRHDDFRNRVRILRWARVFTTHFMTVLPTSFSHEQIISTVGGISGVGKINGGKVSDILPSELALLNLSGYEQIGKALFAVKYASKQLMAYQHAVSIKPVIFVDKSGSMAGTIKAGKYIIEGEVPKISVATGVALAMYRKYNADVYLFDTEVTAVKPADVVNTLLTISADGGTNIDSVIEEINHINKMDYIYIIISDGITEASEQHLNMLRRFAPRVKLILVDYTYEPNYNWVKLLKQYNNVTLVNDVASFENAVKRALANA